MGTSDDLTSWVLPRLRTQKHETPLSKRGFGSGRYWARTSDPQLVELVLSQLS